MSHIEISRHSLEIKQRYTLICVNLITVVVKANGNSNTFRKSLGFFCTMLIIAVYIFNLILGDIILFIVTAAMTFFYVIQIQNYFFCFHCKMKNSSEIHLYFKSVNISIN